MITPQTGLLLECEVSCRERREKSREMGLGLRLRSRHGLLSLSYTHPVWELHLLTAS